MMTLQQVRECIGGLLLSERLKICDQNTIASARLVGSTEQNKLSKIATIADFVHFCVCKWLNENRLCQIDTVEI